MVSKPRRMRAANGSTLDGPPLDAGRAQALAETLHRGQRDAGGAPLIDHVRRVAAAVPREARLVAWLHELLEYTAISEETLLREGLPTEELRALRLLTRHQDSRSSTTYLAHIESLARARGPGAGVAQSVKRADLIDRARHPAIRPDGWSPPYELGLEILERAALQPLRHASLLGTWPARTVGWVDTATPPTAERGRP
jgi:hypothetical protein